MISSEKIDRKIVTLALGLAVVVFATHGAAGAERTSSAATAEKLLPSKFMMSETRRGYAAVRNAAEHLATFAKRHEEPDILLAAITAFIHSGARLKSDDPWDVQRLMEEVAYLSADRPALLEALDHLRERRTKGVLDGPIRTELTLAPGETASFEVLVSAKEYSDVEARLKAKSAGANLDIFVYDATGVEIASELGPETGRLGHGTYIGWIPETCSRFTITVKNVGHKAGAVVLLTTPAGTRSCDPER